MNLSLSPSVSHCPLTRRPLRGSLRDDDAPEIVSIDAKAWTPGRLVVLSRIAARALAATTEEGAWRWARCAEREGAAAAMGLDAAAWRRMASLRAISRPASHAECARQPAVLLPPERFELCNAAHALQATLTYQLANPGWSRRLRELVDPLGSGSAREAFLLWMGALAPRVLELPGAAASPAAMRHALEDLWLDARVQQRWQQCLLALGQDGTEALLSRARSAGWDGAGAQGVSQKDIPAAASALRRLPRGSTRPLPCLHRSAGRQVRPFTPASAHAQALLI